MNNQQDEKMDALLQEAKGTIYYDKILEAKLSGNYDLFKRVDYNFENIVAYAEAFAEIVGTIDEDDGYIDSESSRETVRNSSQRMIVALKAGIDSDKFPIEFVNEMMYLVMYSFVNVSSSSLQENSILVISNLVFTGELSQPKVLSFDKPELFLEGIDKLLSSDAQKIESTLERLLPNRELATKLIEIHTQYRDLCATYFQHGERVTVEQTESSKNAKVNELLKQAEGTEYFSVVSDRIINSDYKFFEAVDYSFDNIIMMTTSIREIYSVIDEDDGYLDTEADQQILQGAALHLATSIKATFDNAKYPPEFVSKLVFNAMRVQLLLSNLGVNAESILAINKLIFVGDIDSSLAVCYLSPDKLVEGAGSLLESDATKVNWKLRSLLPDSVAENIVETHKNNRKVCEEYSHDQDLSHGLKS